MTIIPHEPSKSTLGCERIEIHPHVALFWPKNRDRRTTGNHTLQFVSLSHTAAFDFDQFHQRNPKFALDNGGLINVPADAVQLGTGIFLVGADALEPFDTTIENVWQIRQCFDIVHNGRTAVESLYSRKRRLLPGLSALTFQ